MTTPIGRLGGRITQGLNAVADAVGYERRVNALDVYGDNANHDARIRLGIHVYGNNFSWNPSIPADVHLARALCERLQAHPPDYVQKIEFTEDELGPFVKATVDPFAPDIEGVRKNLQAEFDRSRIGVHAVIPRDALPASSRELPFTCEVPRARVAAERLFGFFVPLDSANIISAATFVRNTQDLAAQCGFVTLPRDVALLGGSLNGAAISTEGKKFLVQSGCYLGIGRYEEGKDILLEDWANKVLYGAYAEVSPQAPKGYATRILRRQLEFMKACGFDALTVIAGKSKELNGYYTWPRIGFNSVIPDESKTMLKNQAEQEPESLAARVLKANNGRIPETLVQLMACYEGNVLGSPEAIGAAWWKEFGVELPMAFDLRDGSESWTAMNVYTSMRKLKDWEAPADSLVAIDRDVKHTSNFDGLVTVEGDSFQFIHVAYSGGSVRPRALNLSERCVEMEHTNLRLTGVELFESGKIGDPGPPPQVFERGFLNIELDEQRGIAVATWLGTTRPKE